MRGFIGILAFLCAVLPSSELRSETAAPGRVVSMNLCTDQLAMMLADPDQLLSVSYIARDPRASAMVEEAKRYEINHGLAEEIYLMQPDLVIAGAFSTRATVQMLKRLGVPVIVFEPAYSLSDVRDRIQQMGNALHQQAKADAMVAAYDASLAVLSVPDGARPDALLYRARGYTSGEQTLAGEMLEAAGFENAAVAAGFAQGGIMPLEIMALSDPDLLITSSRYPATSRSEDILDHPVVQVMREKRAEAVLQDQDWVCGTPYVLRAIEGLAKHRGDAR